MNLISKHPSITVYHKAAYSKIKHCCDIPHFHIISWHKDHPSNVHSFIMLKNILKTDIPKPYNLQAQKVFKPSGFCNYLNNDPNIHWVITANDITTEGQKAMLNNLTSKTLIEQENYCNEDNVEQTINYNTVRGAKYDFIKKIMKQCNSTDMGDIIRYCKTTPKISYQNQWNNIYRNTPNLNNTIQAAATETQVETLATLIWEQIRD